MTISYKRVFLKNHELLAEMLASRLGGMPYRDLTNKYEVDKSSIKNWCRKFDIQPKTTTTTRIILFRIRPNPPTKIYKYQGIFDENDTTNAGKSYRRCLVEDRKHHLLRIYAEAGYTTIGFR